jgi:para-aminobenzoate synthetase component 1
MIRTVLYHAGHALSAMTGSAITAGSDPEAEYAECLLKAEALARALEARIA